MPSFCSTSRANRASTFAGEHAVDALGAGKIEKRLVDRERLDQRRQRLHHGAPRGRPGIFVHVGPHDAGVRAQAQRLEHRHRRAHAVGARDVAGGRDHAALAAADDDRLVGERGIVALFDGGVERVAIDMGDASAGKASWRTSRGEPQAPQRAGPEARSARQSRQKALTASRSLGPAERSAGARDLGRVDPGAGRERDQGLVIEHMVQHAGKKAGLARSRADLRVRFRLWRESGQAARARRQ